ncbi:hypothetical protein ES703_95595 [subsurface metagenome]
MSLGSGVILDTGSTTARHGMESGGAVIFEDRNSIQTVIRTSRSYTRSQRIKVVGVNGMLRQGSRDIRLLVVVQGRYYLSLGMVHQVTHSNRNPGNLGSHYRINIGSSGREG